MFADGLSPIAIAKALNERGIAGPGGRAWRDTTIRGHARRATGILRSELYIGRLVWNRMHFIKDPATGRRVSRMNPKENWVVEEVPQLRIVDNGIWDAVQTRLADIRKASGAADRPRFWERRRAGYLLTGKVFCGCCGGPLSNIGKDYLGCSRPRRQGTCTNTRGIRREPLEASILAALRNRLMQPEHVAIFIEEFTAEWNRQAADASAENSARARELEKVERKVSGLINAIVDGIRTPGIRHELLQLEERKSKLEAALAQPPSIEPPRLHPGLAEVYRDRVFQLHESMSP